MWRQRDAVTADQLCHLCAQCLWNVYWDILWLCLSRFEFVLTVVWKAWLKGTTIAWMTISPCRIIVCRCRFVCVLVLINTSSTLTGLSVRSGRRWWGSVVCHCTDWLQYVRHVDMSIRCQRQLLWAVDCYHLDDSGLERQAECFYRYFNILALMEQVSQKQDA